MTIQLSICIPTYNRLQFLKQSLVAITSQINDDNSSKVEIIISDNSSTDGTKAYLESFIAKNSSISIKYFRQDSNVGADSNFLKVIGLSRGEFVYLVSDDDILLSGAIDKLLNCINFNSSLDAICVNYRSFKLDPTVNTQPRLSLLNDKTITDKNEVLETLGTLITFMSILCFRRTIVDVETLNNKVGTNFIHSYIFLKVLAQENGVLFLSSPLLSMRVNNTGGYDFFKTFIVCFYELISSSKENKFSNFTIKKVLSNHIWSFIPTYVWAIRVGKMNNFRINKRETINYILNTYGTDIELLIKALPVLLLIILPVFFIAPIVSIFKGLKFLKNYRKSEITTTR